MGEVGRKIHDMFTLSCYTVQNEVSRGFVMESPVGKEQFTAHALAA